jgi:hypothetical protein
LRAMVGEGEEGVLEVEEWEEEEDVDEEGVSKRQL